MSYTVLKKRDLTVCKKYNIHLPLHPLLSNVGKYPKSQSHIYDPGPFIHFPFLHNDRCVLHSSISVKFDLYSKNEYINIYVFNI